MKTSDVQIGATYLLKVAGNLVPVKIDCEHDGGGWMGLSVKTGKTIRIKSVQRLRQRLDDAPVATKAVNATEETKPEQKRNTGQRGATGSQREGKPLSLLNAAALLLSQNHNEAMTCQAIVELATAGGLWTRRNGKTPANTLYAAISREIKTKGHASRFAKAERGRFALARQA